MQKTITLEELKPGDIILYSTHKTKISILISILTKSKVSHSGIVDYDPAYSLQEVDKGAMRNPLPDAGTRTLYIRRLEGEPDTTVVDEIAMKYVNENLPYTNVNLICLGLYMLACDFIPDTFEGEVISNLLKIATYEIIKILNDKYHPGLDVPPMVCSQFAAACYDEAALTYGPEYKIHYTEDVATVYTLLKKIIDQLKDNGDKTYSIKSENTPSKEIAILSEEISDTIEAAEHFCDKFIKLRESKTEDNSKHNTLTNTHSKISDELIIDFYKYGKSLLRLVNNTCDNEATLESKETVTSDEIRAVLEELFRFQETFVTPQDLLTNTTNLVDMGILTYTQDELEKYLNRN